MTEKKNGFKREKGKCFASSVTIFTNVIVDNRNFKWVKYVVFMRQLPSLSTT